jgi:hypothetical protein
MFEKEAFSNSLNTATLTALAVGGSTMFGFSECWVSLAGRGLLSLRHVVGEMIERECIVNPFFYIKARAV